MTLKLLGLGNATLALAIQLAGCSTGSSARALSGPESDAIADSLRSLIRSATDLSKPDPVAGFMSVYPENGRVVSATAGRVTTTRDSLKASIDAFWMGVGRYMVRPQWTWGAMVVDVLSPSAAVMTASYTVPHYTDRKMPHVIGGVWTSVWTRSAAGWRITHEHLSDLPRADAERIEALMPPGDSLVDPHAAHAK